jgi:glycosyltransferase involved in cell wall biosynthesis
MKVYIVIPAYNEAKNIGQVLRDLKSIKLPVIVVDDGSRDKTSEVVKKYEVTLLKHRINLGKGAALKTGFAAAFLKGADAVIMMDSDGQHKVSDLPQFVSKLKEKKYDVVFGSRDLSRKVPMVRLFGNQFAANLLRGLFGIYVSDPICGFRALTKKAYQKMKLESTGYGIETEMVIETGKRRLKYCEVPVETVYYDKVKGVTILDAIHILFDVVAWRIAK